MIYLFITLSYLLLINTSKPADTCDAQRPCIEPQIESLENGKRCRICIKFDTSLPGCNKKDTISHSCPTGNEYDKIDPWREGEENKMCKIVDCGSKAEFGIKDGKGCRKSNTLSGLKMNNIDNIKCMFNEGYCGGGNKEDCTWTIPAPLCERGCEEDLKQCGYGKTVERDPNNNCEFPDCPTTTTTTTTTTENPSKTPTLDPTDFPTSDPISPTTTTREPCKNVPEGGYFLAFTEFCSYAKCNEGYLKTDASDYCGCYCAPDERASYAKKSPEGEDPITQRAEAINGLDDVELDLEMVSDNSNKGGNGFNDFQFLFLNVLTSVVTCLLVIAICLTGYYCWIKCKNNQKYKVMDEDENEDDKI